MGLELGTLMQNGIRNSLRQNQKLGGSPKEINSTLVGPNLRAINELVQSLKKILDSVGLELERVFSL